MFGVAGGSGGVIAATPRHEEKCSSGPVREHRPFCYPGSHPTTAKQLGASVAAIRGSKPKPREGMWELRLSLGRDPATRPLARGRVRSPHGRCAAPQGLRA